MTASAHKTSIEETGTPPLGKATHLFISYAIEDAPLADWLARKLANQGYAVWQDRLKMLGGEPWPQDIDVAIKAIKERTFRMLALISEHSMKKPNPSKERTLAVNIARARGIPDFMIPLKVDSVELDWLTTDLTYIPFNRGWSNGWQQLLDKLDSLNAPVQLSTRSELAALSFNAGDGLVMNDPEEIVCNALPIQRIPKYLSIFSLKRSSFSNDIVKKVRFEGWQHTIAGERLVQKELRRALLKYKLHTDQDLFDKAYGYIKQYY